jgi:lipopolysaccharide heptosyltransferase I
LLAAKGLAMTALKRVPLTDYVASRIALIKPSALGDIVQTLPVLTALRRRYPQAHITWLVNRTYEPLLRGHPDLDEALPFDRGATKHGIWKATLGYAHFLRDFRARRFDLVIDLQGLLRSGLFSAASRAPRRVGLSSAREGAAWFYTDVVPVADFSTIHAVDRYWLVAKALGAGDGPIEFRLPIADADRLWAEAALRDCPRPWLAFGVGSRWVTKRWPPEHFAALARRAQAGYGGTVVFVGGTDEAELAQTTGARLAGPWRNLSGRTTLPQLTALLSLADVMVANDTGPLHLAAALGRPIVAPYTCTKVALNGPFGQAGRAVETRVACAGSYIKKCARLDCMTELTPERLWPVLEAVLASVGA